MSMHSLHTVCCVQDSVIHNIVPVRAEVTINSRLPALDLQARASTEEFRHGRCNASKTAVVQVEPLARLD